MKAKLIVLIISTLALTSCSTPQVADTPQIKIPKIAKEEIVINDTQDSAPDESPKGIQLREVEYRFSDDDTFCFNCFRAELGLYWERPAHHTTIIAQTQDEVAEKSLIFWPNLPEGHVIDVNFCSVTDNWVLEVVNTNEDFNTIAWLSAFGPLKVISINYSTGRVTEHYYGRSVAIDETVNPRSFLPEDMTCH